MTLKDIQTELLALSRAEKVAAIQLLAQSLGETWPGIDKTDGICGGEARIINTRIPVWVLIEAGRLGYSEADILSSYPGITIADLSNVRFYAQAHCEEIELAIKRNQAA
ncbi:MAG: hypothetical protein N5P05_000730 [Chroococcopsis gigantea SAG 12.99]|jgi:uncharacterized protein (DUF433 family)|nr:DUF433 domain-containing protein [Chlorogloea purpurea SAG 13.99]MDV2999124.1 hypothetical protein [Chroococcopsis gigantea SAG 12.99]